MRKSIIVIAVFASLLSGVSYAQEQPANHFKPYGFFRSYAFVDSRATKSLTEDMFFFIPLDEKIVGGEDVNAVSSYNFQAITTRLGLDVTGYSLGDTKISGKIEADFYCLNSSKNVGTFRMRQAYVDLLWDGRNDGKVDYKLTVGQTWHPLAADMPNCINLETGAPFSPFNRSAQLMFGATFNKTLTANVGLIQQLQYRSNGPDGSTNLYQRHAVPEVYAGVSYKKGGFLGRAGVDILSIRPHYGYNADGVKYNEWLTTFNPFLFAQYTKGMFQVKAKTVYAQSGEHMQLNSGYAQYKLKDDGVSWEYTPIQSSVSFVSASYGKKFQVMGMVGYMKNLGTIREYHDGNAIYFSGNGFSNIDQMFRVTPTLAYNFGKLQVALEYDFTDVRYGQYDSDKWARPTVNLHWVANHRVLAMLKFTL